MTTHNSGFALVVGAVHLDLLAKAHTDDARVIDKMGTLFVGVGGTAGNIAINLGVMGVDTRLITAMNRGPFSQYITEYLTAHNVRPLVHYHESLPTAAFSAHISARGEMFSAVTSTPIDRVAFHEEDYLEAMRGAACVIVDCNLSSESVDAAVTTANEMKIPVFVAGVSEPKCLRALDITGRTAALFLNRKEAMYLKTRAGWDDATYEEMAAQLNTTLVIARDADGVLIVTREGSMTVPPPTLRSLDGHLLGMGDAFLSSVVYFHALEGHPLADASALATLFVQKVADRFNCNLGDYSSGDMAAVIAGVTKSPSVPPVTLQETTK
jgi:sugar/nucleoside kinase (ribokinase family)